MKLYIFDSDSWGEIWETIRRNRRRSIITAFGVFWGIFMLVVMLGAGKGLDRLFHSLLGNFAVNSCFVQSGRTGMPYKGLPAGRWWNLENEDMEVVRRKIPGLLVVTGVIWGDGNYTYSTDKGSHKYQLMGYAPEFQIANYQPLTSGRFINDIDMQNHRKVCVIGQQVADDLFPGEDPVGQRIKMNTTYFTVIGVAKTTSGRGISFSDVPRTVMIPFATLQQMYNMGGKFHAMIVTAEDNVNISKVETQLKEILRERHTISPEDTKAIRSVNVNDQFQVFNNLFIGISLLTWIVGAGTLIAGVVGISNIMLVVVRERTQEIGVRRALGAPPAAIITQIMSESFALTFVAGVLGLTLAVLLLTGARTVFAASTGGAFDPLVTFGSAMTAFGVLLFSGLLAGIIPAVRAVSIKPVDAIREE